MIRAIKTKYYQGKRYHDPVQVNSASDQRALDIRDELTASEKCVIDEVFEELKRIADCYCVKITVDDRASKLAIAFGEFIMDSRENGTVGYFDDTQAVSEGWSIVETDGSENGPYQLQKIDEFDKFKSDDEAWLYVYRRANEGSAYHQQALAYLDDNNPKEYEALIKFCRE
jgi:hypothetical protein